MTLNGLSLEERQRRMREHNAPAVAAVPEGATAAAYAQRHHAVPEIAALWGLSPAFERHFAPKELAELWGFNENTIRRLFIDEPDVLKYGAPCRRGKRQYITLRIPQSVAERVHRERSR